jgi:hypothetical protein
MFDSIGSLTDKISNSFIITLVGFSLLLLILLNFWDKLKMFLQSLFAKFNSKVQTNATVEKPLSPKQIEELSNSLVGKFMTDDLIDGKDVIGLKGTLISEHIAFEAEKRGLLQKLSSISAYWPVEN